MPLKVGIIGAGIGGLSAAIALRSAGAEVELFESSSFKNEIGAAITITPNGSRILHSWGFDGQRAGMVEAKNVRMVDAKSLKTEFREDFEDITTRYGAQIAFYHRVDLHNALKQMAEGSDTQPGVPASIKLGNGAIAIDCKSGIITLADGTTTQKDLVVIADGIKSQLVGQITGKDEPIKEMPWSAYRCLIPMEDILADEKLQSIFESEKPGFWAPFHLPTAFYLIAYPCRDNKILNIALRHTTQPKDRNKKDWNSPASVEDVLELLKDHHPLLSEIMKKATDIKIYKLLRREPLRRYANGRAVVIGDAAHTILPTHAQGAVMAIEEAAALELLFQDVSDATQVPSRLELFSKLMKPRIHITQHLSDSIPGTRDEYRQMAEELCGEELFPCTAMNFTAPVQDFFYSYDVRNEITKGMQEAGML
ncbi:hypothetical protein F5Y18DRAFT_431492 [Xylariaceae sp. FL1019]|nr:hypothetical protein F5Y18DRAFT_431492 [Xylariaceae sp. FL1019]